MQNNNRKIVVGITQGDGNGIGYEVIIKALADARILDDDLVSDSVAVTLGDAYDNLPVVVLHMSVQL